jgi:hypothetical protein
MLVQKSPYARMLIVPNSYHEILCEKEEIREAVFKVINDYFSQRGDDVSLVEPVYPLQLYDHRNPIYSWPELIIRGVGVTLSVIGVMAGVAMVLGGGRKR